MSAQPSSFVPTPAHVFVTDRETRKIKANHQQLQHVINRITNRLEVPDKAARGIAGIHGVFNGREAERFPLFVAHKWTARQLNFKGKDDNADQFMCRVLAAISDAEKKCGRRFFKIKRADGVTQIMTSYECDFIGEVALWALAEARRSEDWKKNPAAAITDELIGRAIEKLPVCEEGPEESDGGGGGDAENVIKGLWTKIENAAEANIKRSVEEGINPLPNLDKVFKRLQQLAEREWFKLRMSEANQRRRHLMNEGDADGEDMMGSGKNISDNLTLPPDEHFEAEEEYLVPDAEPTPRQTDPPPPEETQEPQQVDCRAAAQFYASAGIPVFPCKLDKSPYTLTGFKMATTRQEQVAAFWKKFPEASVGIPTGKASGWVVLDVDIDKGGDASLCALDELIGGLPETLTARTGSGGTHFFFKCPEGVEIRNSAGKLGVGLDIRGEGGYVIAAPSPHPSGGSYQWISDCEPAPLPQQLIEMLTAQDHRPISTDYRPRSAGAPLGVVFHKGERNDGLFRVGCAIWGRGQASDLTDLHHQMLGANDRRCAPPLDHAEVAKLAANIAARYVRGVPIDDEQKPQGGTAS